MAAEPSAEERPQPYGSGPYRWYVLGVLTLVFTFHALDRGLPNILIEPIRREFGLSDSQLGAFSGLGFAVAYCITVLPMGFIADRFSRRNLLAVILVIWSLCTAFGGLARNYSQLMLARVGVGGSESGAAPVVLPMISDIFPASQRGRAMGVVYTSQAFGLFLASVVGGFVAAHYGWRAAFFIAGLPGILLAILLVATVREPRRGDSEAVVETGPPPKATEVFVFLWKTPGVVCLILGGVTLGMVNITISAWLSSFFIRVHGLDLKEVGLIVGIAGGLGALIGAPLQGWLADRFSAKTPAASIVVVIVAALVSMVTGLWMLFTPSLALAVGLLLVSDVGRMGWAAPVYASVMGRTPVKLRSSTMSVIQLVLNLMGYGVGPFLVGMLSDFFGGGAALRYAMAVSLLFSLVVALLLMVSMRLLYPKARPA